MWWIEWQTMYTLWLLALSQPSNSGSHFYGYCFWVACMHSTIVSNRVPVFLSTFGLRCLLWRGYSCSILQLIPLILMVSLRVPTSAYNVIFGAYTKAYGMIILGSHLFRLLEFFFFFFLIFITVHPILNSLLSLVRYFITGTFWVPGGDNPA